MTLQQENITRNWAGIITAGISFFALLFTLIFSYFNILVSIETNIKELQVDMYYQKQEMQQINSRLSVQEQRRLDNRGN
jgi:hypothetical protein